MLGKQGFDVHLADTPAAVHALLNKVTVSTVIVAMDSTGIDGLAYIGRLAKAHPAIVTLAITENPSASQVAESLELGAKDYFVRPIQDWNRFYFQLEASPATWSQQLGIDGSCVEPKAK